MILNIELKKKLKRCLYLYEHIIDATFDWIIFWE